MCFSQPKMPEPPPPPPPPPMPPAEPASEVESARPATTTQKRRRGTRQLTVRRPTLGMGGGQDGTGVQLSQ